MVPSSKLNSLSPLAQTYNCKRIQNALWLPDPWGPLAGQDSQLLSLECSGSGCTRPSQTQPTCSFPLYLNILDLSPSPPKTPATASPLVIGSLSLIWGFWALWACQTPLLEFPLASWHANPSRWSVFNACFFPQTLWGFNQILIQKSHYKRGSWDNENES